MNWFGFGSRHHRVSPTADVPRRRAGRLACRKLTGQIGYAGLAVVLAGAAARVQ